jgi:hypothetical protein
MSTRGWRCGRGGWPPRRPRLPPRRRPGRRGDACSSPGGEAQPHSARRQGMRGRAAQGGAGSPRRRRIASRRSGNGRGDSTARPELLASTIARSRGRDTRCRVEARPTARPRNAPRDLAAAVARGRPLPAWCCIHRARRAAGDPTAGRSRQGQCLEKFAVERRFRSAERGASPAGSAPDPGRAAPEQRAVGGDRLLWLTHRGWICPANHLEVGASPGTGRCPRGRPAAPRGSGPAEVEVGEVLVGIGESGCSSRPRRNAPSARNGSPASMYARAAM